MTVRTIAAVALGTGLRRSELVGLKWGDVDFDAGNLHVVGRITIPAEILSRPGVSQPWSSP